MNTFVLQLDEKAVQDLIEKLSSYSIQNNNAHVRFAAKFQETTILIYTSGKAVFQGKNVSETAQCLGFQIEPTYQDEESSDNLSFIGSDEVGNGSYFGSLAVVASFVQPSDYLFLKELGVDDSKNLTDAKIRQIAPLLEAKISHKALLLTPQKYNQVVGPNHRHNAVSVKVAMHNQAIFLLLQEGAAPDKIVIDAFTSPNNYQKYVKGELNRFTNPISLEEKAEGKYLAVAVSSIIARKLFLDNLAALSQEIGFNLPSGAGTQSDKIASQILRTYGEDGLRHTAKLHFKNTKKAYQLLK
ncbi:ribonuclease HIII [Streptococcus ratti]|uniref:Ribonuclease HIII n=1 Tax=Streptococcus ratti TaxID=1341 RepID=A0A7X9QHF0_STRRT|nr:ribonuclease HIII [Streptococcus ratti]NMD49674.1 ribonuclease HIII [Streptococcus ratti]